MIKASEKENAAISENALTAYGHKGSNQNSAHLTEPLLKILKVGWKPEMPMYSSSSWRSFQWVPEHRQGCPVFRSVTGLVFEVRSAVEILGPDRMNKLRSLR